MGQKLGKRIQKHKINSKPVKIDKPGTAPSSLHFVKRHNFKFRDVAIMDIDEKCKRRVVSEMIHIQRKNEKGNSKRIDSD